MVLKISDLFISGDSSFRDFIPSRIISQKPLTLKRIACLVFVFFYGALILGCNQNSNKNFVLDCSGKTGVSDYVVGGASTEKHTVDTIRLSFEGKNVYLSGTAAKHYLKTYEVCNDAERISFEDTCKRVIADESKLAYSVDSYTGQYDTAAKKLKMSTAMRSYERANLSESFHMKSQALRGGTYTCSKFE